MVYLSKENAIEEYNVRTNIKRVLYEGDYLRVNARSLMCLAKRGSVLVLVFRTPLKLFYIQLAPPSTSQQLPSTSMTMITNKPL